MIRALLAAAAAVSMSPLLAHAQPRMSTEPITYTLRFPAPETHYVEVEASVPAGQPSIELMMAVWTPGSYLVREYERHVERVAAKGPDGAALVVTKTQKNRWRVEAKGAPRVTVTYQVYGREMSVRTNWIESRFALLNGAPTFLTLVEKGVARPHDVALALPAAWKTSVTSLAPIAGEAHRYRAASYDELVDSPFLLGNPTVHRFEVGGKPHVLANEGEAGVFDGQRAAADLAKVVAEAERLWGSLPYERYAFINVLSEAGGGLEHKSSTVLMASRWATSTRRPYLNWLTLAAHEHFHAWNVKRLRPIELGPFDYERENPTTSLWMAEGFTAYYEHMLVRRAGLMTDAELIDGVGADIRDLQTTPGRLAQPVATASSDAWIKHYRPDENTPNTAISYYTKGAVIGFVLDAKIRQATSGAKSLDDVMRLAYSRYSGAKGFTEADFKHVVHDVAGRDFGPWWTSVLQTTDELTYDQVLDWFGLRFKPVEQSVNGPGKAWLGATTKNDGGRLVVTQVRRGTPAHQAGVNVDDEILAIDDFRVRSDGLDRRLEQVRAGTCGDAAGGAARRAGAPPGDAGPRAVGDLASRAEARRDAGAAGPPQGVERRGDHVVRNAVRIAVADVPVIAQQSFTSGEPPVSAVRYAAAAGVPAAGVTVVVAHGAGAGMSHPFLVACATGLAARGCDAITFNFPYMEGKGRSAPNPAPQLEACYRALIATLVERGWLEGRRLVIGGKSMGGRMATMVAAAADAGPTDAGRAPVAHPIAGVVALGYPLHPPGQPQKLRVAHFATLRTPLLVVQGTRDTFGGPGELAPHLAPLGARATIHPIERGDHSFKVTGLPKGTRANAVLDGILDTVAAWCRALPTAG